ncbi:hypothetical protein MSAN_00310100 [Mycena sanguinolenta]|uniref:Protein kinase domain-containing protein n=1 Tax=Mycena sanguinolenta TaxID=230812 RepID=A0A8H6ZDG6_9AGAR|nr:hypothetical protein MSAN_00310100 [Mycena sanguinolenta]
MENDTCLVRRRPRMRRVFAAKIEGTRPMTVFMYEGHGAEDDWHRDIAKYMSIRHPNIIQIYAAASSNNIHATIFHDDMIPFNHFLDLHRDSPLLTVYIHDYCNAEFKAVSHFFFLKFKRRLSQCECTFWIRRSTGRLCADLVPGEITYYYWSAGSSWQAPRQGIKSLDIPDQEAMVVHSLTLAQYHKICDWDLARPRYILIPAGTTVTLGTVISCSPDDYLGDFVEIAFLPDVLRKAFPDSWLLSDGAEGELAENGWTRFNAGDMVHNSTTIWLNLRQHLHCEYWLSQANHIFSSLKISSGFENYVVVDDIEFKIIIPRIKAAHLSGFLFLCPPKDLQTGPSSFRWPSCPAYWSLDPSGVERLSKKDAARLGFPCIRLAAEVSTNSWDAMIYAGLRQFHRGKGFDPDSQDVARHLGHPFYRLSVPSVYDENREQGTYLEDERSSPKDGTQHASFSNLSSHTFAGLTAGGETTGRPHLDEEMPVLSRTFQIVMSVQLTLILFLALASAL